MSSRQIFQTTLIHPIRPEYSISSLFVCASFSEHTEIDSALEVFGIKPISGGSISESELKRVVAYLLSNAADIFDMNDAAFRMFVNRADIDMVFLDQVLNEKRFIVEEDHLEQKSLLNLLKNSFGAAVGQYSLPTHMRLHDTGGHPDITLLIMNLPYGVLLCGSLSRLDRALHCGLKEKICSWLLAPKVKEPTPMFERA